MKALNLLVFQNVIQTQEKSEEILIDVLPIEKIQRNTIILLGAIKSKSGLSHALCYYKTPKLKRVILYALKLAGKEVSYSVLISGLSNPNIEEECHSIIIKIGSPIAPYLISDFSRNKEARKVIISILDIIGVETVYNSLLAISKNDPELYILVKPLLTRKKIEKSHG